jgi:hypothetical protein
MTTTTHTIKINENPRIRANTVSAKRVSKSRMYEACVVATATAEGVADIAIGLADHEAKVAELTTAVAAALTACGFKTAEEFKAFEDQHGAPWLRACLATEKAMRDAKQAANGGRWSQLTLAEYAECDVKTAATGLVNPYGGDYGALGKLIQSLRQHTYSVAHIKKQNVQVGDQLVVTWCRTAALADKAARTNAKWYGPRGFVLTVRTDIEVTTK